MERQLVIIYFTAWPPPQSFMNVKEIPSRQLIFHLLSYLNRKWSKKVPTALDDSLVEIPLKN